MSLSRVLQNLTQTAGDSARPLLFISNPWTWVLPSGKAGVVGSFPALNARGPGRGVEVWLQRIYQRAGRYQAGESEAV